MIPRHQIHLVRVKVSHKARRRVKNVLKSGQLASGPMVKQFEAALKTYIGSQNVMAVSNGTSALQVALRALDLGPGDEVITTPFTFGATWNAILSTGATLVYVDISSEDFNIQIDQMAEAITSRTRVLLPVHLYGSPLDLQSLQTTTQRKEIRVVEDCAQAIGATSRELHVGTLDIGTFSFYATKNITTGEGGAVTSQDDEHSRRVRLLRNQGFESPYNYEILGENHRMTDIAAAIGLGELASYQKRLSQRTRNAEFLLKRLREIETLVLPAIPHRSVHSWHQFTVRVLSEGVMDRDHLAAFLRSRNIGVGIYYPKSLNGYECFKQHPNVAHRFAVPIAENAARTCLSLPIREGLRRWELERVCDTIEEFFCGRGKVVIR